MNGVVTRELNITILIWHVLISYFVHIQKADSVVAFKHKDTACKEPRQLAEGVATAFCKKGQYFSWYI